MYNHAVLMGRICNDIELKTTNSGLSVCSFRIAVERKFQSKGEEKKTDFFNCTAWRQTAEFISKYFTKGKMILVDGELNNRDYDDKNGVKRTITELVVSGASFTGEKADNAATGNTYSQNYAPPVAAVPTVAATPSNIPQALDTNEDYPF